MVIPELISHAFEILPRSREIARRTGLGGQSLYKALSPERRPELATVVTIVRATGLNLTVTNGGR